MTNRPTPAGILVTIPPPLLGSPAVLTPVPPPYTSYAFTNKSGVLTPYESGGGGAPVVPTTGQIWPRGNR